MLQHYQDAVRQKKEIISLKVSEANQIRSEIESLQNNPSFVTGKL
jgi:hypothetical protein